ncbi:hypothetical protein HK44_011095 [Pseudomonas fluorescens HK44]|uniref:Uncharacterized protein n=1 Tax=Pseudomonas fluorescens HK44 TaxID=1042209 RepID=A0A010T4X1_PSEFL|nr:hypothetical protein HK44_011095 [Pseudomonas fluorescens HK44]
MVSLIFTAFAGTAEEQIGKIQQHLLGARMASELLAKNDRRLETSVVGLDQ